MQVYEHMVCNQSLATTKVSILCNQVHTDLKNEYFFSVLKMYIILKINKLLT